MKRLCLTNHDFVAISEKIRRFHRYNPLLSQYKIRFSDEIILKEIENFIKPLKIDKNNAKEAARHISGLFIEHTIPFAILIEDLEIIKDYLIRNVCTEEDESEDVVDFFNTLKNYAGYFFLKHDVEHFEAVESGHFKEKLLYSIHNKWQHWLIDAIKNENMEEFPLTEGESCPFLFALDYPESKMICHELNICNYLKKNHHKLHELAIIFAYLFIRQHYKSAYVVFHQIKEYNQKLLNLVSILYFNAQINRHQTFKNYLYHQTFHQNKLYIAIFDIFSMREINKLHTPKVGDKVIELVGETLNSVYLENQGSMVYTKGISGDFYILFENCSLESIEKIEHAFDETLKKMLAKSPHLPKFIVKKAFLKLDEPLIIEKDEMAVIFSYLKEQLKKNGTVQYLISSDEQKKMMEWINDYYWQIAKLKEAMEKGKVEIFLQPISYMERIDRTYAFEVLARIEENGNFIPAGAFIDLFIEMKMVSKLDFLVLDRILYHSEMIHSITGKLFINVSASTLLDSDYIDKLIMAIRGPLVGTEIIVELTEQVLLENLGLIVQLHEEHGLIFAIDDFGTGYSSLQTVIQLAEEGVIRYLKIDGSLTQNFENSLSTQRILKIISEMSQSLNLETIVEFVETENQCYELATYNIDYGQGYHLGKPQSIPELEKRTKANLYSI